MGVNFFTGWFINYPDYSYLYFYMYGCLHLNIIL
jgi:hypothetical protein